MKNIVILALFVTVCVSSCSSLRCYDCFFPGEPKCENVKDLSGEECTETGAIEKAAGIKAVCLKTVTDVGGAKQITRKCSKQGGQINACSIVGEKIEHCSACETDLCNKSSFVVASIWSVALPVVTFMFKKLL